MKIARVAGVRAMRSVSAWVGSTKWAGTPKRPRTLRSSEAVPPEIPEADIGSSPGRSRPVSAAANAAMTLASPMPRRRSLPWCVTDSFLAP